jgi:hypothetical protein
LRFVDATPGFRVVRGLPQKSRIVVEISKARVASEAKEAAEHVELVTVINAKSLLGLSLAECASAVLPRKNGVVVQQRHPILPLEHRHKAPGKLLGSVFGIRCISLPTLRINLRLMGFLISAVVCFLSFSPFQIFEMVHVFSSANR